MLLRRNGKASASLLLGEKHRIMLLNNGLKMARKGGSAPPSRRRSKKGRRMSQRCPRRGRGKPATSGAPSTAPGRDAILAWSAQIGLASPCVEGLLGRRGERRAVHSPRALSFAQLRPSFGCDTPKSLVGRGRRAAAG